MLVVLIPILIMQGYKYYDVFRNKEKEELLADLEIGGAAGRAFDGFIQGGDHGPVS